jgi:hypothetical protein
MLIHLVMAAMMAVAMTVVIGLVAAVRCAAVGNRGHDRGCGQGDGK